MIDRGFDYAPKPPVNDGRIKMDNFKDVYGNAAVEADKFRVKQRKANFKQTDEEYGTEWAADRGEDLEYIVNEHAELNCWFGDNSYVIRTSEYDDYFNHVDAVVEFDVGGENGSERIALLIDTSLSKDDDGINSKITRNRQSVERGSARVKYFSSQVDDYKGELASVIPVVIGVDQSHVDQMMDHMGDKKYFEEHPAQVVFLKEIDQQLEMYQGMYKIDENNLRQIGRLRDIIGGVLEDKREIESTSAYKRYEAEDLTYGMIGAVVDAKMAMKKAPAL